MSRTATFFVKVPKRCGPEGQTMKPATVEFPYRKTRPRVTNRRRCTECLRIIRRERFCMNCVRWFRKTAPGQPGLPFAAGGSAK